LIQNNPFVDEGEVVVYDEFDWTPDSDEEDLYSFLRIQIDVSQADENIKNTAYFIIDHLNGSGLLAASKEQLINELGVKKRDFDKALQLVQSLDPPGVGAQDIRECLLIQLESGVGVTKVEKKIILEAFEDLMEERYKGIAKKYGVHIENLVSLRNKLLSLDVCPAAQFKTPRFITHYPDIIMRR